MAEAGLTHRPDARREERLKFGVVESYIVWSSLTVSWIYAALNEHRKGVPMQRKILALSVVLVGTCLLAASAAPALSAEALCPMGGAMVVAKVDKDKALVWAADLDKKAVCGADTADWSVLTLSRTDKDIAILLGPGYVFFGVAGRGGEVYPRDIEKAFRKDFGWLRDAVRMTVTDLWKAGALKIAGADVQKISDATGLGSIEKDGTGWALKTKDCQAVDLPASGL